MTKKKIKKKNPKKEKQRFIDGIKRFESSRTAFWILFFVAILSLPGSLYLIYEKCFLPTEKKASTKADVEEAKMANIDYLQELNKRYDSENEINERLIDVFTGKTDSIDAIVNTALKAEFNFKFDEAISEWRKLLFWERIGNDGHSSAWFLISKLNRYKSNYLDALEAAILSNRYAREIDTKDSLYFLEVSSNLAGLASLDLKEYGEAISYHKTAIRYAKDYGDTMSIGQNLGNIANVYLIIDSLELARSYADSALIYYEKIENERGKAFQYANIGSIFFREEQFDSAIHYHEKALPIFQNKERKNRVITLYSQLGIDYFEIEDTIVADSFFNLACNNLDYLTIPERTQLLLNMGGLNYQKNRFENASYYYKEVIPLLIEQNDIDRIISSYFFIAMSEYKTDDSVDAISSAKKGIEMCIKFAPNNEYLDKFHMLIDLCSSRRIK